MPRKTTKAQHKAVRKATTSKAIPTGTTISYGDEKVEYLLGPYVPLILYFRHHRHWCGPEHNGEPRPMDRQFIELEREGTDCLYRALNALVEEIYPLGSDMRRPTTAPNLGRWGDMRREHAEVKLAWAANNGAVVHRAGPMLPTDPRDYVPPYGATYTRAHHQSVHSVMVPHVMTHEEAERENTHELEVMDPAMRAVHRPGDVYPVKDTTQGSSATAEQVGHRWAEVYAEEVRHLLGDEPNDETLDAFAHLHANLKGYVFGSGKGARVMHRMKPKDEDAEGENGDSLGAEVLAAFDRIRGHLNALLDEMAEEHVMPETMEYGERITWRGLPGELAEVFHQLAANEWIEVPRRGRAKLARRLWAMFRDVDGNAFDEETLVKYLQPGAHRPIRHGWKFEVSKRPNPSE